MKHPQHTNNVPMIVTILGIRRSISMVTFIFYLTRNKKSNVVIFDPSNHCVVTNYKSVWVKKSHIHLHESMFCTFFDDSYCSTSMIFNYTKIIVNYNMIIVKKSSVISQAHFPLMMLNVLRNDTFNLTVMTFNCNDFCSNDT